MYNIPSGLAFIHARYGYGAAGIATHPDAVLDDFARLPDLVAALARGNRALTARP